MKSVCMSDLARTLFASNELLHTLAPLSSDDVFQEISARYRAVELSSGSNVIPRRARPGLAGLRPHMVQRSLKIKDTHRP